MIPVPVDCPRGRTDCRALANITADDNSSFFCCGENNGEARPIAQGKYTVCFKGPHRDCIDYCDGWTSGERALGVWAANAAAARMANGVKMPTTFRITPERAHRLRTPPVDPRKLMDGGDDADP